MTGVFADTWYFLALVNPSDAGHPRAVAYTKTLSAGLVTTTWVLTEMADALAATAQGRAEFVATRDDLCADPNARIISGDDAIFEEGVRLYAQRSDKQWSLTDCISFVVMKRANILEALTKDHHFEQAGFVALLK